MGAGPRCRCRCTIGRPSNRCRHLRGAPEFPRMNVPDWTNEAARRARIGQSALYIANAMDMPIADVRRIVRRASRAARA